MIDIGGESHNATPETISDILDEYGFMVQISTCYSYQYNFEDNLTLNPEDSMRFEIPVTIKDSFMCLEKDQKWDYISADSYGITIDQNKAAIVYQSGKEDSVPDSGSFSVNRDTAIYKTVVIDGVKYYGDKAALGAKLASGDVYEYLLRIESYSDSGEGYDCLPIIDRMNGAVVLLAPVELKGNRRRLLFRTG